MEVQGTVHKYESVSAVVDPAAILDTIKSKVVATFDIGLKDFGLNPYINSNGVWETWENGHGSGYTETYRVSTPEEFQIMVAFDVIQAQMKKHNIR